MSSVFTSKYLSQATWEDFALLVQKHNGVWGGCWCTSFHQKSTGDNRTTKECLVREGRTHAALVYDGDSAVGWCQFGPTSELPRIKHRRQYDSNLERLPDWRITCFFVDRDYRGRGIAAIALAAVLDEIGKLGGGTVESYPEDTSGRRVSASFIYNGTVSMFEKQGFKRRRQLGSHHWVVEKVVEPAR